MKEWNPEFLMQNTVCQHINDSMRYLPFSRGNSEIRQNYPILVAQEELDILKNTPGNPEYDKAQAAAKQAQDEINTSNNPQTAIDEWQSNQLFPCGNGPRRTGARLPFSLYYF